MNNFSSFKNENFVILIYKKLLYYLLFKISFILNFFKSDYHEFENDKCQQNSKTEKYSYSKNLIVIYFFGEHMLFSRKIFFYFFPFFLSIKLS